MRRLVFLIVLTVTLFSTVSAQVQVSQEPRHHKVFENEWVRILDVRIGPGDTSQYHKHSTPSIFIVLGNTKTGSQAIIEPIHRSFNKESIWFEGFYDTPRIHRVWNEDTVEFHTIDMEFLHKPVGGSKASESGQVSAGSADSQLLFDEKPVRAYRVSMAPNKSFRWRAQASPVVVIGLSGPGAATKVNGSAFGRKGDYLFIPAGSELSISNDGTMVEQVAVFVLK